MEPTYRRPDAFLDVPIEERDFRTMDGDHMCAVRTRDDTQRRFFLRVLLPVPVLGHNESTSWGLWVEVAQEDYKRTWARWSDPDQAEEPPFEGRLANELRGYSGTVGLPGTVQLTGPDTVPTFRLDTSLSHRLAVEQRNGVPPDRVIEWLLAHHP